MLAASFNRFFWPRAAALQFLLLGLWWFVLYQPSLALLHLTAQIPFGLLPARPDENPLEVDSAGEWKFIIPIHDVVRDSTQSNAPVNVHASDFSAPAQNVAPFATAWFVYLGLALNAPLSRANLRRILLGLAIQTAVSSVALLGYAEINARGIVANMHRSPDALSLWLLKLAYHIDYLVVPYAGPFLVLLATHPGWRTFLTKGESPVEPKVEKAQSRDSKKPRRHK